MNQDHIVALVKRTGVNFEEGTRQVQWHQVRFRGLGTGHSLNLGYSMPKEAFVADFVFKGGSREMNIARCIEFCRKFGGEVRSTKTVFARIEIPFEKESSVIEAIRSYWSSQV